MDIQELNSFNLGDAVKFHSKLNPKLWIHHKLDPEVREQLLIIAKDFVSTLGIRDLDIVDITVSGSNAAYSYTPHSDLDLHIIVNIPKLHDEVYRELFTAKKTLYNDSHDITVHGVPVELYVQDVNEPVKSLGEYSVTDDRWIHVPKKKRANFDEASTKAKYENLSDIVDLALRSRDLDRVEKTIDTIRRYRKAGLHKGGEFGPENLAFKAIRSQGGIDKLYDLRDKLRSEKLSIEEATSREDAIMKIKKLQNTSGRTPAEISTINNIIDKLTHEYNIKPHEITDKSITYTDPLDAKMAAAAYEKAQAAAAMKDEWKKFKGRFKDIFTEDELVIETTQQSQDINTVSDYLAKKILTFIKKNDRNILNYFKTHDEHSVILFTAEGKDLDFPPIVDRVLTRVLKRLQFEVTLNESLPDVPAESKIKPLGAYYPGINKIIISVPGIKMYSKYYGMPLHDSLRSTIAHEITHALDDAKSYSAALMPQGEYLKLPQEVNARFQEALLDISRVLMKNKNRLIANPDRQRQMSYLKYLIKWAFEKNRLDDVYEINDPRYKRLVTRTYKFYEAELAKPEFQTISKTNLVQKALDWISSKTLEETQLDETVEESQVLKLVSKELATNIIKELKTKRILNDFFTISKKARLKYYGIKVKDMNLPLIHDPVLDSVLDRLTLRIEFAESQTLGKYLSSENYMELNLYKIRQAADDQNLPFMVELTNVIAHELQHAIDDYKSKGKALAKPAGYDFSIEQYLRLNHEINARLQQTLVDISYYLNEREKADGTLWTTKDLPILIEYLFAKHHLTRGIIKDTKQYNRLLTRTYKFFVTELTNPKKVNAQSLLKRAYNYIVGKPTSEIHEASGYIPSEKETIEEIGFADILDNLRSPDNEIISNSIVSGTIGQKPVRVFKYGRNTLYFFSNDTNILALVLLEGSHLKAIKNFTNEKGMVYSLLNYIVSFEGKRIDIAANEPFTPEGFEWLLRLATNTHGLRLTTSSGDKVDIDQLKREWNNSRSTKEPGETSLVISEMSGAWKKQLVENENSLMPYRIFEYSDQLAEASGYIPSEKEKNDPRFKTALTVDVKPDSIKKNAKAFNWKTSRAGIPPQARPDGKITENSVVWKSATKFNNEQEELNHILNLKEDHRVKLELLESFARQQGNISEDLDNKVVDQVKALVNSFSSKNPTVGKNYIPVPITIFHGEVMFHDVKNNYPADTKARFGTLRQYSSTEVTFDIYGKLYSYFEAEYRKMTGATIILVENEEQYDKLRMQVQLVFEQTLPALEKHREEK